MSTLEEFYGPVISSYTRAQAIEDGVLVDGMAGDFGEVTPEHYKWPVAMAHAVFAPIEKAVNHPKHCNDFKGVWHDVLWMSRCHKTRRISESVHLFLVIITGTGRKRNHTLKLVCGPGDNAEPVIAIMLPNED